MAVLTQKWKDRNAMAAGHREDGKLWLLSSEIPMTKGAFMLNPVWLQTFVTGRPIE
jgi:hypothetical protein